MPTLTKPSAAIAVTLLAMPNAASVNSPGARSGNKWRFRMCVGPKPNSCDASTAELDNRVRDRCRL